uniref:Uncharacterized protein n=1 Tax=Coccolithus braarudii TaxID=221442 RepID=A0A7S0L293_9EUKA
MLDVHVTPLYDVERELIAPHGLVGQSFDGDALAVDGKKDYLVSSRNKHPTEARTKAQAEGAIEGEIEDYRVADGFSTNFSFSRFDSDAAKPRLVYYLTGRKQATRDRSYYLHHSKVQPKSGPSEHGDDGTSIGVLSARALSNDCLLCGSKSDLSDQRLCATPLTLCIRKQS